MSYQTKWIDDEVQYVNQIEFGDHGKQVKRVQEWLGYHGFGVLIDADYGPATQAAVSDFQTKNGLASTGTVDQATWGSLVAPMCAVLNFSTMASLPFADLVLTLAKAHLALHPREFGGDNCGPWVRMYMNGIDGKQQKWCAGFVSFILHQAAYVSSQAMPIKGSVSCDELAHQARQTHRFISGNTHQGNLGDTFIFLVKSPTSTDDWIHTGIGFGLQGEVFTTIEGNTNDEGSANGYEVCSRKRRTKSVDFIRL